uniref:Uncharacterized protein n=1 Tax=Arundo donax TaxID=35708 RepID=A0A0A9DD60_ARUDO
MGVYARGAGACLSSERIRGSTEPPTPRMKSLPCILQIDCAMFHVPFCCGEYLGEVAFLGLICDVWPAGIKGGRRRQVLHHEGAHSCWGFRNPPSAFDSQLPQAPC